MKYLLAYTGSSENAETLVKGVADSLYEKEIEVVDLNKEEIDASADAADIYVFSFEMQKGNLPVCVMDALEYLEEKTILFLIPCNFPPTEEHEEVIENKLVPFLPDDCDYKGIFLCMGQIPHELYSKVTKVLEQDPEHETANQIMEYYNKVAGHPNDRDIDHAVSFILERTE